MMVSSKAFTSVDTSTTNVQRCGFTLQWGYGVVATTSWESSVETQHFLDDQEEWHSVFVVCLEDDDVPACSIPTSVRGSTDSILQVRFGASMPGAETLREYMRSNAYTRRHWCRAMRHRRAELHGPVISTFEVGPMDTRALCRAWGCWA